MIYVLVILSAAKDLLYCTIYITGTGRSKKLDISDFIDIIKNGVTETVF